MKILFLTFYFPPDICAGSFRNGPLVEELKNNLKSTDTIEVLTTFPNRYANFSACKATAFEKNGSVSIHRVKIPHHKSGMLDQSRCFLPYVRFVQKHISGKKYDVVYASSSRLMTAVLGSYAARKVKARLYLDIRDIFVDTINDVLPGKLTFLLRPFLNSLEKYAIKKAATVNLVSEGFFSYFQKRYPGSHLVFYPNGIDKEFLEFSPVAQTDSFRADCEEPANTRKEILYAGNIGDGQGLHKIIPELALRLKDNYKFKIIGGGGKLDELVRQVRSTGCPNIDIHPSVDRHTLIEAYRKCDVLFLHLNNYNAFLKVLPSKIFEYGATGKPILAGVGGYAATFIQKQLSNAQVFMPCDVNDAQVALSRLNFEPTCRKDFIQKYSRENIFKRMALDILHS